MQETFHFDILYNPSVYTSEEINLVLVHLKNIVAEMIEDSEMRISDIRVIDESETNLVQYKFNDTAVDFPSNETVTHLFEEQVKRAPESIAIISENEQLTYQEMNERVNQLARKIRKLGAGVNDCIAIMAERSIDMVIGIYAIIKAGCAYVPISPSFPDDRIKYILEDCNPKAILLRDRELSLEINKENDSILVNEKFETSRKNILACGNAIHCDELSKKCVEEGMKVGKIVKEYLIKN